MDTLLFGAGEEDAWEQAVENGGKAFQAEESEQKGVDKVQSVHRRKTRQGRYAGSLA